jgi:hypothetical protein
LEARAFDNEKRMAAGYFDYMVVDTYLDHQTFMTFLEHLCDGHDARFASPGRNHHHPGAWF